MVSKVTVESATQIGLHEKEPLLAYVTEKVRESTSFRQGWIWVLKYGCSPSVGSAFLCKLHSPAGALNTETKMALGHSRLTTLCG